MSWRKLDFLDQALTLKLNWQPEKVSQFWPMLSGMKPEGPTLTLTDVYLSSFNQQRLPGNVWFFGKRLHTSSFAHGMRKKIISLYHNVHVTNKGFATAALLLVKDNLLCLRLLLVYASCLLWCARSVKFSRPYSVKKAQENGLFYLNGSAIGPPLPFP